MDAANETNFKRQTQNFGDNYFGKRVKKFNRPFMSISSKREMMRYKGGNHVFQKFSHFAGSAGFPLLKEKTLLETLFLYPMS